MSCRLVRCGIAVAVLVAVSGPAGSQTPDAAIQPATHVAPSRSPDEDPRLRLLRELVRTRRRDPALAAQLIQLSADLSPADGAQVFEELATEHARAGDFNQAAETRRMILERYPDEPVALAAARWLVDLYSSGEVAKSQEPSLPGKPIEAGPNAGDAATGTSRLHYQSFREFAVATGRSAIAQHKTWSADPALAFALFAAERKLAGTGSTTTLRPVKQLPAGDPWGDVARLEAWLIDPQGEAPRPLVACPAADPPRLDGVADDECWNVATRVPLGDHGAPAELRLARDHEYLYLAFQAPRASGATETLIESSRTHDSADLLRDHVRLLVDVDRDYATWFELIVDDRGHTADRAWTATTWNPEWFVAAASDDAQWRFEAAIPWTSLVPTPPTPGETWALGVERIVPGASTRRSPERDPPSPASFAALRFE